MLSENGRMVAGHQENARSKLGDVRPSTQFLGTRQFFQGVVELTVANRDLGERNVVGPSLINRHQQR